MKLGGRGLTASTEKREPADMQADTGNPGLEPLVELIQTLVRSQETMAGLLKDIAVDQRALRDAMVKLVAMVEARRGRPNC
jgi:hypothetical protein